MNPTPFPQRLSQAPWAAEWPFSPRLGAGDPPRAQDLPDSMAWAWHSATSVMAALDGSGDPVQLDLAHRLLDELESWTQRHRAFLTWPATPVAFANALVSSARNRDPAAVAVVVAYPDYCRQVLGYARHADPSIPELEAMFAAPAPTPAPEAPSAAAAAPASTPKPATPPRPAPVPATPPAFLAEWVAQARAEPTVAVARHHMDQNIKSAVASHPKGGWAWFNDVLLPAMACMEIDDLRVLVQSWPPHARFTPPNPVAWADSTRFWVFMRDAGPERREVLCGGGLASLVDVEAGADTRLAMITKMLPFVAKKPEAFRQRLALWQSLGGDLDAPVEADAVPGTSATSAREWIAQQENPEWDGIMLAFASPAVESKFRRRPG